MELILSIHITKKNGKIIINSGNKGQKSIKFFTRKFVLMDKFADTSGMGGLVCSSFK